MLAQGRYWRAELGKSGDVVVRTLRDGLKATWPDDHEELKDLRVEIPLSEWGRVLKMLRGERKLLGGLLLDFARTKDALPGVIARDRLVQELQTVIADATLSLVEQGRLCVQPPEGS
jgi:hypothetical protein